MYSPVLIKDSFGEMVEPDSSGLEKRFFFLGRNKPGRTGRLVLVYGEKLSCVTNSKIMFDLKVLS
jgi:hypothetical protein